MSGNVGHPTSTPEYWETQGYQRNWGDCAVMNWPVLEILRGEFERNGRKHIEYVLVGSALHGGYAKIPAYVDSSGELQSWGEF